jgi:hypothetical protein
MLRKESNGIIWLEFELFQEFPFLRHGSFLRRGGVSRGPFQSLNVGFGAGDCAEHVEENRARILRTLSPQKPPCLITGKQIHGDNVHYVEAHGHYETLQSDSLITRLPDVALMIRHADCQAAIIYDPQHRALAVVHSGWKGSALNIYSKTIAAMQKLVFSRPENLLVGISPSLGPESSEFKNYKEELPPEFWNFQIRENYFDFWKISEWQLQEVGVLPHHIEIAKIDTFAHKEDYFSYRREKLCGRNATCAWLT